MLSSKSPLVTVLVLLFFVGCSASKTDRGYLIRHESAWEVNRTPWIGCPPDSHCDGEKKSGFFDCLKKDSGGGKSCKKFRRHCGVTPDCMAKNPCCKTLGCGMWIDPSEPMTTGNLARACGLTPFCSPMKPCSLTPYCGKPAAPNTLMLGNAAVMNGGIIPNTMVMPSSTTVPQPTLAPPAPPAPSTARPPTIAGPNGMRVGAVPNRPVPGGTGGMLVSMGIVPGVSTVTTGGLVAAAGVATPAGMMTPNGVMLPNGMLQNQGVIRVCVANPNCSAARPCGLTAGCGMIVPVTTVSNNAVMLASALNAPGVAGNVMPAYGNMPGYVNGNVMTAGGFHPMTGQPVHGLSMNGTPQVGYPPIAGRTPWYPQQQHAQMPVEAAAEEEEEEPPATPIPPRSQMPAPRFHPVPTKPAFQRSEGLPTTPSNKRAASGKVLTRESLNAAMEQAYLEGIADAMQDVQDEIDAQNREIAKAELQAKIERQATQIQAQLDARQQEVLQAQYRQTQLQQAQLQQVQFQQASLQSPQFQQTPHQPFAAGQGAAYHTYPAMMQPPMPQTPRFDGNHLIASTKAAGSNFAAMVSGTVSPLGELFGVGQPKTQPPQYRHPPRNPYYTGMPQPVQTAQMVQAAPVPVRAKPQQQVANPAAPRPSRPRNNVAPQSPIALMSDCAPLANEDAVPPRPTTAAKKPTKVVEVDDDVEPNMVQSANFVVRGS